MDRRQVGARNSTERRRVLQIAGVGGGTGHNVEAGEASVEHVLGQW